MKIPYRFRKRYFWALKALRERFILFLLVGILGGILSVFLTQTSITINQTPSLTYKAFICFKGLKPQRGDFVSIQNHPTTYFEGVHYTKRLMGIPGDRIQIKINQLYVEDTLIGSLQEATQEGKSLHPNKAIVIPQGYVFVSADHPRSFDSRYEEFGLVKKENIKGPCFGLFKTEEAGS